MNFVYDDGGRSAAGFKGHTGDCVVRAIAIATGLPYRSVYDDLFYLTKEAQKLGIRMRGKNASPRFGVPKAVFDSYLEVLGWTWTPTMKFGQGCTTHLDTAELPSGRLVVQVSKHVVAIIDGVIHDTYDPSRGGTRCVYGYWRKESA